MFPWFQPEMVVVNERAQDYGGRAARYELQLQLITAINDPKMTIEQLQRITNDYPVSGDVSSDYPVRRQQRSVLPFFITYMQSCFAYMHLRACCIGALAVPFFGRVVRIRCI